MTASATDRPLRRGWTTGACAAGAATAAFRALVTGEFPDPVTVVLPRGVVARFPLARAVLADREATAGIIKDAGDDPDVTHGAEVVAAVTPGTPGTGVGFRAGEGVGTVTRPGLPVPVGEPAINPAPRRLIADAIAAAADDLDAAGDVTVTVSIPGGEALAARTANPRLGIVGGLSILGTTGVVVPYSCSAWLHSVYSGVDVARATGLAHIAAATGSTSEAAVQRLLDLPDEALIDVGDFVGGLLKYVRRHPVPRLTVAGGFAKMCKLAQGALYLHSSRSRVDFGELARLLGELGAGPGAVAAAGIANTAHQVLEMAQELDLPLAQAIAERARGVALSVVDSATAVDVAVFDRDGTLLAHASQ